MKCRLLSGIVAAAGLCFAAQSQVIISEVVSGSLVGANPKFVELFNASATQSVTLGAGWKLRLYSNGATTASATNLWDFSGINEVTLLPGQTWTIANPANTGAAKWDLAYPGNSPSVPFGVAGSAANSNGDDVYTLENNDVITDAAGNIGEQPAVGATWNYVRSYLRRKPNVCAPRATFDINEWLVGGSNALGTASSDANLPAVQANTSPNSHSNICATGNDCNGNGRPDATDIATGFSRDCNQNAIPDECDISSGASRDCNTNGVPDECEIAANPALDCNANGVIDSCEIAGHDCNNNGILDACDIAAGREADLNANGIPDSCEPFVFDCNGNMIEDATDILNGTSQDCNHNIIPDECELATGMLTDANGNGIPDSCEGAYVGECVQNATVQPSPFGVRNGSNGLAFCNVEGSSFLTFASYGGLRFDMAAIKAQFDAQFGAGQYAIDSIYLHLNQANAPFSAPGPVDIVHSGNDAQDFADNAAPEVTFYENYATDFADGQTVATFNYAVIANGHADVTLMWSASGTNTAGGDAVAAEVNSGAGNLTLLLHEADPAVAATYAGYTNFTYRGPSLVIFAVPAGGCPLCAADYNQDGGVDGSDVAAFFPDWENSATCADVNLDGGVDGGDVETFFSLWEAGDANCGG